MITLGEVFPRWYYSIPTEEMKIIQDFFSQDTDGLYRYMYLLFCDYTSGPNENVVSVDIADKREVDEFLAQVGIEVQTVIQSVPKWSITDFRNNRV